jgi:uncharacterized membrane protein
MTDTTRTEMQGPEKPQQGPFFSVTLTPHRSLGPRGFLIVMGLLSGASFLTGLAFAWIGAWPVLAFFGLDVLLVFLAFKLSYRAGRLLERVDINRDLLTLTRVHPTGRRELFEFSAYWVRILLNIGDDGRSQIRLASHGREITFGQFLTNDERETLTDALRGALAASRQA